MGKFIAGFDIMDSLAVFLVLFAVIDIIGSIPIVIDLRKKSGDIEAGKATLVSMGILLAFLWVGEGILGMFNIDVQSFAIAGAIIMFMIALEMILNVEIFKESQSESQSSGIVPLAFPLIAGAGSLTTIISLKATYANINILFGILFNMLVVFVVLKTVPVLDKKIGKNGTPILRRVFGIILLSIAIKLFKDNLGIILPA